MISRLVHYAADAVLVSTFLAGVKRTTGYTPDPTTLPLLSDPSVSSIFTRYLSIGETIFDRTALYAAHSQYFKQTDPAIAIRQGIENGAKAGWERVKQDAARDGGGGGGGWFGGSK